MATTIKLRRGTAAQWNAANPVLAEGEVGIELQAGVVPEKAKLGDGVTAWNALPYSVPTDLAAEEAARIAADNAHAATPHGPAPHPDLAAHDTLGLVTQAELDVEIAQLSGTYVPVADLTAEAASRVAGDALAVHLAGTETVTGIKTFNIGTFLDKGSEVFNAKAYGAVNDGVTDDTAAINAAIAAIPATGGVLYLPGPYFVSAHFTIPDKVRVAGNGIDATIINFSADLVGQALFGFGGSVATGDAAVLSVNTSVGQTALTVVSTAGIVAGSYYILGSDQAFSTENTLRYKGELVRVFSVNSATGLTLYSFIRDIYTTATAASLRLVTYKTGNGVSDLTIRNTAPGTGATAGFTFQACKDVRVTNVRTEGLDNQGINLLDCLGGTIIGYHAQDHTDDEANNRFGYGVNVGRATENVAIIGSHFRRVRHGFTCDGSDNKRGVPRNIVVSACTASNCTSAAFDTHATGQFITFQGCSATQSSIGFQARAQDLRILGCSASHCSTGLNVKADAHGLRVHASVFRHLRAAGAGTGVEIPNSPDRVTIAGCTFDSLAGHGISITGNPKRVKVLNNEFSNIGQGGSRTTGIIWSAGVTASPENVIGGNTFINETPGSSEADVSGGGMTVAIDLGGSGVTSTRIYPNTVIGVATYIANLGANVDARPVSDFILNLTPPTGASIPAGVTEYIATNRRGYTDLSGFTEVRMEARVADNWNSTSKLALQYSTNETDWFYLAGTASASAPAATEYVSAFVVGTFFTSWVALPTAARGPVHIRMVTLDGDATASGNIGRIALQAK